MKRNTIGKLFVILIMIAISGVLYLFKSDILIRLYGVPFTPSQYSELIAEDRQTELGIRQEWKDSLESGAIRKIIDSRPNIRNRKVVSKAVLHYYQMTEALLRNLKDSVAVRQSSAAYLWAINCAEFFGYGNGIKTEILKSETNNHKIAELFAGRSIRFQIHTPDAPENYEECYARFDK